MSNNTNAIIAADGDGFQLSIHPQANTEKAKALSLSEAVKAVTDPESKDKAVAVVANIKALTRACEKSRKDTKEPILTLGKQIDSLAKEYSTALEAEASRIERLIGGYVAEEQRKLDEIRRKQREEQDRLARAQAEKERLERLEAEQIRLAEEAKTKKARDEAARQAAELAEQLERVDEHIEEIRIDEGEATDTLATAAVDNKAEGAQVRQSFDIEVLDLAALYKAYPQCVKLEPKLSEIRRLIESGVDEVPGVNITASTKVSVRAGTNTLNLK